MDKNQKYTLLLNEQIGTIRKENRYLEFKSNYQEAVKRGRYPYIKSTSCEAMLLESIKDHGKLTQAEIDDLLWDILPDRLNENPKRTKTSNMLRKLRGQGVITNTTVRNIPEWSLV